MQLTRRYSELNRKEKKLKEQIRKIVQQYLENDDVKMDIDLFEQGIDSIIFIKILVAIEALYDIEFPDENLVVDNMNTIHKIVQAAEKLKHITI